jgi:hypothetical protein
MIYESSWTGHKFAINLIGLPSKPIVISLLVGEFIQREQIEILPIFGVITATLSLIRSDNLTHVFVDKLSLADIFSGADP